MKRIRRNGSVDSELAGCHLVRELMVADSGETLDSTDQREVEEHVRECVECIEYRYHLRRVEGAVHLARAPMLLPDPAIEGRLKSALRARAESGLSHSGRPGARSEASRWRAVFAVAAAVALLLVRGSVGPLQTGSAVATPALTAVLLQDSKPESTRTDALTMTYRLQRPLYEVTAVPSSAELFPASSISAGKL